ncbi:hypothetical protein HMPREF3214_00634 [Alloscardovia omnicolens]|nr:hypothetical protein HMPREF3214_00634 [Alloscardovia omnicolens]
MSKFSWKYLILAVFKRFSALKRFRGCAVSMKRVAQSLKHKRYAQPL